MNTEEIVIKSENGEPITTSMKVAQVYGKQHKVVLRIIERIISETSEQNCSNLPMFEKSTYPDKYNRQQPMYIMNRDGYTLVAMSFTGAEAMKFKLEYINAFNKMEEHIKNENSLPQPTTALQAMAQQAQYLAQSIQHMAVIEQKQMEQEKLLLDQMNRQEETENRTTAIEQRLDDMEKEREENGKKLLEAELSEDDAPALTERNKCRMLVNQYCNATNTSQQDVWHEIYKQLYYKYGISINSYRTNAKESKLDIAEKRGFIHQIFNIVSGIVGKRCE